MEGPSEKDLMGHVVMQPNTILVELDPDRNVTPSGIIIPESAKGKQYFRYGTVHKVGPATFAGKDAEYEPTFKPGDRVYFPANCGHVMEMDDRMMSVMRSTEPICGWTDCDTPVEPFRHLKQIKLSTTGSPEPFSKGDESAFPDGLALKLDGADGSSITDDPLPLPPVDPSAANDREDSK